MNAARMFGAAIIVAGGMAYLLRYGVEQPFTVSIQPSFHDREGQGSPLGTGVYERFTAYMAADEFTLGIVKGERLRRKDRVYHIRRIETVYLGEEPVYRKALLLPSVPESGAEGV